MRRTEVEAGGGCAPEEIGGSRRYEGCFERRVGKTVYVVRIYTNDEATETAEDKLVGLIRNQGGFGSCGGEKAGLKS